jgi:hypothetical protein
MKIWFERILNNSSYLRILYNYYKNDTNEYQKVGCYTISNEELKNKTLNKIKIDDSPIKTEISYQQKEKILNYINDTILSYHNGEIHLSDLDLKYYDKVYSQLSKDNKVKKELLDYIVNDMLKSFNNKGHRPNQYTDYFH